MKFSPQIKFLFKKWQFYKISESKPCGTSKLFCSSCNLALHPKKCKILTFRTKKLVKILNNLPIFCLKSPKLSSKIGIQGKFWDLLRITYLKLKIFCFIQARTRHWESALKSIKFLVISTLFDTFVLYNHKYVALSCHDHIAWHPATEIQNYSLNTFFIQEK